MGKDSELIRLEAYVGRLLDEFSNVRAEKLRLEQEIQEQYTENKRLKKALDSVDSERTDVSDRVNSLIERLEQWESELESDAPADGFLRQVKVEKDAPARETGQGNRENGEDGGTVQKRLFNT